MMTTKRVLVLGGTLAALGGVGYFAARPGLANEEAPGLAFATVERQDLELVAEASGQVEPIRMVEVKSKSSGEVLRVFVETGDRVEQGALLAEIDPRDVQSALEQAVADVESARVQLSTADANRARMEELRSTNAVTQQEYESSVQASASARASVVRAETALRLARERRNDVTIRAPISGTILVRQAEPGQIIASATSNVSGGTTLFTMADLSEIQVRALVDEVDMGQIQPGQPAQVTVDAFPGRTFRGEVYKIEPQAVVEQNVTTFPVLVRLPNPGDLLKPGMNGEVSVVIASRRDAVVVPNSAVAQMRDAQAIANGLGIELANAQQGMRTGGTGATGAPAGEVVRGGRPGAGAGGAGAMASIPPECVELFQRRRSGGGPDALADADRARLAECRPGGGQGGRQARGTDGEPGARPGTVFVQGASGPEARAVLVGLSDWEKTEIIRGLEPGETVIEVTAIQMQQQQIQDQERMRQRAPGLLGTPPSGGTRRGG